MKRPDLDTLACVNPECQRFRRPGEANLTVRKVYGADRLRLLRCRTWWGVILRATRERLVKYQAPRGQSGGCHQPSG
jgi:hypothetical protein